MFTVKATYRNETRRFTFQDPILFPTYEQLQQQLCRIFPLNHSHYLSRLIFSPDASKPGRILVGKEVHTAEDYDARVAPLRRQWPNPLLRFTVFDGIPHGDSAEVSQMSSLYSAPTMSPPELTFNLPSPTVPHHSHMLLSDPDLLTFLPPSSSPVVTSVLPPPPQSDRISPPPQLICFPPSGKSCSPEERGTTETTACCSIARGRTDMQKLLSSFKEDFERILCRTLGTDYVGEPPSNIERSTSRIPGADVILPQTEILPVGADANTSSRWCFVCKTSFTGVWYGCIKCPWHAVCPSCFYKSHSAHTLSFGPSHIVQQHTVDRSSQVAANVRPPAPISPGPVGEVALPVHTDVLCDDCNKTVTGIRHKCLDCPDYDLCTPCMQSGAAGRHNSLHEFLDIETPGRVYVSPGPVGEVALPVHTDVLCDDCNKTVTGIRHKCLDCPDYDLCTPCMQSGAAGRHNSLHEFLDIETPGRVYVHTVFSGERDRSLRSGHQPSSPDRAPATRQELPVHHFATCNLCDSGIVGERFKCVACPDFDTCSSCFRITTEQHPNHGFVKINKQEDLIMHDSIPSRQITHSAMCDSCQRTIRGARYKCMHPSCPDFDLCSDCEALPIHVHPPNHALLKLKTSDAVIPTIYRSGQAQMVDEPATQGSSSTRSKSSSVFLPTLEMTTKSPKLASSQVNGATLEEELPLGEEFLSPLGSPASQILDSVPVSVPTVPSHLLVDIADLPGSPQSTNPASDIYHQLWPRVNQEMIHLNAVDALEAEVSAAHPLVGRVAESNHPESSSAEDSLPGSPAPLAVQAAEHRTYPTSPVPSIKSIVDGYRTPSSTPFKDQELHHMKQQPSISNQQEVVTDTPRQGILDAALVGDANVPDGQIFPPGAEFVKGWRMVNNGMLPWPTTTHVQFVAGEMFASERSGVLRAKVGVVHPGQDLDIWTGDLKAPDVPGRYVGYWRLSDGQGNFFGSSVWIDLTIADHHSDQASEQSLAASSMVMPRAHPTHSVNASDELREVPRLTLPSTKTVTDEIEDPESDISSVSLVSAPTSDDEDAEWQDTRTHSEPMEYVVLYDRNSE